MSKGKTENKTISCTIKQLEDAFHKWTKAWEDDPESFMGDGDENYDRACAEYMFGLLEAGSN